MSLPAPRVRLAAVTCVFTLAAALIVTSLPADAAPPEPGRDHQGPSAVPGHYIVTLKGAPIAAYSGGITGLKGTRPSKGRKVNAGSPHAKRYRTYLERQQDQAAARVGAKAQQHFAVALNGFTTTLTPTQAKTLATAPGVVSVTKDIPREPTDDKNPVDFLRLSGRTGLWEKLGGKAEAGRGVVVGIIDTGYWPESPSFAGGELGTARPGPGDDPYRPYKDGTTIKMKKSDGSTFVGFCEPGETPASNFTGEECNTKVISARHFSRTYKANTPVDERTDYIAARARDGHGSHVGSTAVGNADIPVRIKGRSYGKISGVAPAAKMAVYKVCFTSVSFPDTTCYTSDSLAAIDQAVTDGVDVINYSISSSDSLDDPVDQAYLFAAAAGIFVSAAAGNTGPGPSTLDHVAPWLTTVAASTVAPYAGTVVLGNGRKYAGISTTVFESVGPAPLVAAARVRRTGVSVARSTVCLANTLDPVKVAGKIVVCDRGVNSRVEKSDEVDRAGGTGMVLVNLTENSSDGDIHAVPTVHLNVPYSRRVREYALTAGARATLKKGNLTSTSIAYPQVAAFSSRGPSLGTGGDVLKPDIAAPGVTTLAAVSPDTADGELFDFYSGTSMAAPHVAGVAALYFGEKPNWSPMAVKSAMMTTSARLAKKDGSLSRDYYAQGAGNVRPSQMFNPGLVFDSGPSDWLSFLEAYGYEFGAEVEAIDPSDFNAPSIAVGKLVGSQTVTRKVTAVKTGLYRASVRVDGVDATVTPSLLAFTRVGQTKTIKVRLTRRSAPVGEVSFGSLALVATGVTVRVPIAVTPQAVDAPAVVRGTGAAGSSAYSVRPGFSGPFPITARGLDAAEVEQGEVTDGDLNAFDEYTSIVPPGTRVARFTSQSDNPRADIDMEVYGPDGELVAVSAGPTGLESVTLFNPAAGPYQVVVYPFADPPDLPSTAYEYRAFAVGPNLPNFSVAPANPTATEGVPITVTATWTGLSSATPYLGYVEYVDGTGTFVEIN